MRLKQKQAPLLSAQRLERLQHELACFGAQLVGGRFGQHANKRFGAAGSQKHAAAIAQELFCRLNRFKHSGISHGCVFVGDIASTGDGILTSLRLMEAIRAERETLSQLCAPVKLYPQLLTNVRVADKDAAMTDAAVLESEARAIS